MGPTKTNGVTPKVSTLGKSSSPRSGLAGAGAVRRSASEGTGHIAGKTSGMRHTEGSEQSIEQEAVAEVIGAVPAESMSSDQANDEDLDGSEAEATAAKPAGNTDADHAEPEGMRKADAAEPVPAVDNTQTDDERRIEQPALPPMQETIDEPENGNGHLMEESNELIEEIPDEA